MHDKLTPRPPFWWRNPAARLERQRLALVDGLVPKGIWDPRVLKVMKEVPRHQFLPARLRTHAYRDRALPIGRGQTISQPFIVALMTQALHLRGDETVLEVGTGSGYQTAILSALCRRVYTVEVLAELAERAQARLAALGCANVAYRVGDGWAGWPEAAPFDAVVVTAAPRFMPEELMRQLVVGGRLVVPIGNPEENQVLWCCVRTSEDDWSQHSLGSVVFVPMTGKGQHEVPRT